MSDYTNFAKFFPQRCSDLLELYRLANVTDREVTLLLTVASAGITIPKERLENKNYPYPFDDNHRYQDARDRLYELLEQNFQGSVLLPKNCKSWCFGPLAKVNGDPDNWAELQNPSSMPPKHSVKKVIKHIRNSLAHGSIHTYGDPISKIIFVASVKPRGSDFNYLLVSPEDFLAFLKQWFKFLGTLEFPSSAAN